MLVSLPDAISLPQQTRIVLVGFAVLRNSFKDVGRCRFGCNAGLQFLQLGKQLLPQVLDLRTQFVELFDYKWLEFSLFH